MQLKKQLWKRIRHVVPCRYCGGEHQTVDCDSRRFKRDVRELMRRREEA
jgi:hypothetical protein